jgi:hypothetical protein
MTVDCAPTRVDSHLKARTKARCALRREDDNKLCFASRRRQHVLPRRAHVIFHPTFFVAPCWRPICTACSRAAGYLGCGGRQGKDGRMKNHGTAPAFSFAPCKVSRLFCPRCRDLIIAATKSQHVSTNEVRHWWACETCGYEFRTTVRWQSSPPQSVSTIEETVPQSLQSQKDHCPDGISSGV